MGECVVPGQLVFSGCPFYIRNVGKLYFNDTKASLSSLVELEIAFSKITWESFRNILSINLSI